MSNETDTEFDRRAGVLRVHFRSYGQVINNGELTDEFIDSLLKGYQEVEESGRKTHQRSLTSLQKLREAIRKKKKDYTLPITQIHLHPQDIAHIRSEHIRTAIIRSIGTEAEISRMKADRWELFEDLAVGADLLIDFSAITMGVIKYLGSGEMKEGVAGFGYLAILGMGLLIAYFILRIAGEEPCKRKAKYLTHILRTPVTLHRRHGPRAEVTFYPDDAED